MSKSNYEEWLENTPDDHNLKLLAASGARVKQTQVDALIFGNRELVTPHGDVTVKSSFMEGITPFECFAVASAGRMSLASNALVVPESGYLARQLVSICHDITITAESPEHVPEVGDGIIHRYGPIRPCDVPRDLSTGQPHPVGCRIGLIAAQAISERLTQQALSQKHAGGAKSHGSISMLDSDGSPIARFKKFLSNIEWNPEDESGWLDPEDLRGSYDRFSEQLDDIAKIEQVHKMVLFRGMTSVLVNGKMRDEVSQFCDTPVLISTLQSLPLQTGRFLKGLRYGYVAKVLSEAVKNKSIDMLDSERAICGKLPKTIQKKRGFKE